MGTGNGRMGNPFQRADKVARKLKVLVYGASGAGKTYFCLNGWPGRIALIDTEGGADLYGGRFDFDVLRTKSIAEITEALEYVKADAGRTYGTLAIDPVTVVWSVLQDAGQQMAEGRAQKYNKAIDDVTLTQRDWGIIKRRLGSLMTELVNLPVNVILTARERDVYEERGKEIVRAGVRPDAEKSTPYLPDLILHMVVKDGKRLGIVEKDRSGYFNLGQVVPDISFDTLAPILSMTADGKQIQHQSEQEAATKDKKTLDTHWIDDDAQRGKFWKWVGDHGLSNNEAHEALGVTTMREFAGTAREACEEIKAWLGRDQYRGESSTPPADNSQPTPAPDGEQSQMFESAANNPDLDMDRAGSPWQ